MLGHTLPNEVLGVDKGVQRGHPWRRCAVQLVREPRALHSGVAAGDSRQPPPNPGSVRADAGEAEHRDALSFHEPGGAQGGPRRV